MLNYIDIFSGAGGMSEGFRFNGFNPIAYVEMNSDACKTLETRNAYYWLKDNDKSLIYQSYLKGDISREDLLKNVPDNIKQKIINLEMNIDTMSGLYSKIDNLMKVEKIENVDLVIGGPPCQSFSIANKSRRSGNEKDPRNYLYKHYVSVLEKYNPKVFVFENVLGLRTANNGNYLKKMKKEFENLGYEVRDKLLNSKNYGVFQNRKRIIVVGSKVSNNFFEEIHQTKLKGTIDDLLSDLPPLHPGERKRHYNLSISDDLLSYRIGIRNHKDVLTWHVARLVNDRDREIYKNTIEVWNNQNKRLKYNELPTYLQNHKNLTSFLDRFKVVAGNLPYSHTLTAHLSKDGHYYIHPDVKQARSISVREAARIQSFSDDYYFEGSRTSAFIQIGNAVPPKMASSIAKAIQKMLYRNNK